MVLLIIILIFCIVFHKFNEKEICDYIAKEHPKLYIKMGSDYPSQESLMLSQKVIFWKLIWGNIEEVSGDKNLQFLCNRDKVTQILAAVSMLLLLIVFIKGIT